MTGAANAGDRAGATSPTGGAPRIFISYRREDSEGHTGRLYDALAGHFGAENVFMDIDAIPLGVDFTRVITEAVSSCDVLIAVIGREWLTIVDPTGGRRLDNPEDFVRLEIKAALERDVRVIPAVVQNAEMPGSHQLPDELADLARRNGIFLRSDTWRHGVERVIRAVEDVAREKAQLEAAEREAAAHAVRERAGADLAAPWPADEPEMLAAARREFLELLEARILQVEGRGREASSSHRSQRRTREERVAEAALHDEWAKRLSLVAVGRAAELGALPATLRRGETVLTLAQANVGTSGLLVLTNERLLFLRATSTVESMSLGEIERLTETGNPIGRFLVGGKLEVTFKKQRAPLILTQVMPEKNMDEMIGLFRSLRLGLEPSA